MQLSEFIIENYPAKIYLNLAELMDLTKTKTTQILNDPASMTKLQVIRLSKILQMDPTLLVDEFNCGRRKMNLIEAEELMELKQVS